MKKKIRAVVMMLAKRLGLLATDLKNEKAIGKYRKALTIQKAPKKTSIWIVGCGRMGIQFINAVKGVQSFELKGIIDRNVDVATNVAGRFGIPKEYVYGDTEQIQSKLDVAKDVLIIATTANSHFPIMEWALGLGVKKIFLEKPLTQSLANGQKLIELADANDSIVYVDHTRRWMQSFGGLKNLLNGEIIGKLERMHFYYGEAGVAMIGSHFFDLVRFLSSADVSEVRGVFDELQSENMRGAEFNDPSGYFQISLKNGIKSTLDLSSDLSRKHNLMYFIGSHGRIEVDLNHEIMSISLLSGKSFTERFPWSLDKESALVNGIVDLANGSKPLCSLQDGYAAIEAVIAATISAENQGIPVQLPLSGDIIDRKFPFA